MFLRHIFTLGGFTLLSRVLGLVRETFFAHFLGVSIFSDVFLIAFKLPNFLRRFFAEGAFSSAFVPIYAATKNKEFAAQQIFSIMFFLLLAVVIIIELLMSPLMILWAPGLDPNYLELATAMCRITFPYIMFLSLASVCQGVLTSRQIFATTGASPLILNIVLIATLYLFKDNIKALCIAVSIAGLLQFALLYSDLALRGHVITIALPDFKSPLAKTFFKRVIPASLGAGVMQLNLFLDLSLASWLPEGSISYLYYADRLNQLPIGILGVSLSTALLPLLSNHWQKNKTKDALGLQQAAVEIGLLLSIPASIGLILLAKPIIQLIYGHGKFSADDIVAVSYTLMLYAMGLPAYVLGKIFSTSFFAQGDSKTPVIIASIFVGVNLVLNISLMFFFSYYALAVATSLAAWGNALALLYKLKKQENFVWDSAMQYILRLSIATFVMVIAILLIFLVPIKSILLLLSLILIFAAVSFCCCAYFMGLLKIKTWQNLRLS